MSSIIIVGGDKRQAYLKDIFEEKGFECTHINYDIKENIFEEIKKYDYVMLPLPFSKDKEYIYSDNINFKIKVKDIINILEKRHSLIAGGIDRALSAYLDENEISYFDYTREDFTVYNSYLTAQGALKLLLDNTQELICSKKVLITGFGNLAKALAETMQNNGTDVYICARDKVQLTQAECKGYKTVSFSRISSCIFHFDYIFNTVPFNVFTLQDIQHLKGKYFELASKPYGVKQEYFAKSKSSFIDGSSLPGKYLPLSAARKIAQITFEYLKHRSGGD